MGSEEATEAEMAGQTVGEGFWADAAGGAAPMVGPFGQFFELDDLGGGVFERDAGDKTWWGWNGQFGGYVMGLALEALRRSVTTPGHREMSFTAHFLRRVPAARLRIAVTVERTGRTVTNLSFRVSAPTGDGGAHKLCVTGLALFGSDRNADDWVLATPPDLTVPTADEAPEPSPIPVPATRQFAIWPRHSGALMTGADVEESGGWMQLCDPGDPGAADERFLLHAADGYLPLANIRNVRPAVGGTLDFTAHFRQPVPQRVIDGEPVRVVLRSARSHRGAVDEDATVWASSGELLLQSRQLRYTEYLDPDELTRLRGETPG